MQVVPWKLNRPDFHFRLPKVPDSTDSSCLLLLTTSPERRVHYHHNSQTSYYYPRGTFLPKIPLSTISFYPSRASRANCKDIETSFRFRCVVSIHFQVILEVYVVQSSGVY
ncbi:hypothetical protein RchiOBHm_Chr3g0461731 [Rosa chinensis]|uniref:Uncharacterized protein n=1 Tax=Rosa chinensis TaxID=74649 RepID=A0A2P6R8S0_ROSCH|nr:hypothetical protein RchiOBHm_Chr3g0461731 [Rosa chinensis]